LSGEAGCYAGHRAVFSAEALMSGSENIDNDMMEAYQALKE